LLLLSHEFLEISVVKAAAEIKWGIIGDASRRSTTADGNTRRWRAEGRNLRWALMEPLVAICAGIALSAACGFRVFVPMLALGIAARAGVFHPSAGLEWVQSIPALVVFGAATVTEIAAYYIPWVDHALDTITTPGSIVAGTLAAAAAMGDLDPAVKWSLAIVAGGGTAGIVQGGTVITRGLSGATTGGLGNPVVSTGEAAGSIVLSILAIVVPLIAAALVIMLLVWVVRLFLRWRRRRAADPLRAAPAV
jgi:hypothetical protein